MTLIHGFELLREQDIPEINTHARIFRHARTGLELISMENEEENKAFGIAFTTPPADATGLPHILEHSVLCGSRKYPVKEPFIELAKGSLNTFLNAFTFPDKTVYPVASQNTQDFYNLIDVYLDSVFYPLITPETLQQEGWHYELENASDPLTYKGVVFNEMKGAYSDPDNYLSTAIQESLLPDTIYGVDSGGNPAKIPDLTYEDFKSFHETYYHPSNARVWFYGDDDPDERLRLIDDFIQEFGFLPVNAEIKPQPRFSEPRRIEIPFNMGEEEKGKIAVSWLLIENTEAEARMGLSILEEMLVGTPASPLRKALIDSGLGEDLTPSRIEDHVREIFFTTGMTGVNLEDTGKVEALILDTLKQLAETGFEMDMVEAAINTVEFQLREQNTGRFPRGLALMLGSLSTWVYGQDPLSPLAFEAPLASIKARLNAGEHVFADLVRRYFVDNPHRTTVIMLPDDGALVRDEEAEKSRLEAVRARLNQDDLQGIVENTLKLRELQEMPDSPENLAKLPVLALDDLDRQNKAIPLETLALQGTTVLYHDLFTNGITYLDIGFNLRALPQEYLPYVSLFSRALVEIGTESENFVKLAQRIGRETGGIDPVIFNSSVMGSKQSVSWLFLRGKSTVAQTGELFNILRDVLLTVKLDSPERFRQMVMEEKAGKESELIPRGHIVVHTLLRSHFTEDGWVDEQMGGVNYLHFLRGLAEAVEKDWPSVLQKLETMRAILLDRSVMIANVTLDADNWAKVQPQLEGFLGAIPAGAGALAAWTPAFTSANQGLTIPAKVNYVGKGANLYDLGYQLHGSVSVINKFLGTTYLWEKIRVQGGAYGGFSVFDRHSGVFDFLSYRDPNLLGTLTNYDGTASFLRELELPPDELTKSIIGTIGDMDDYLLPDAKGYTSMVRYLIGDSDERRQKLRDEVLSTTADHFKAFGDTLAALNERGQVVVLGSAEAINDANAKQPDFLKVSKVL